MKTEQIHQLLNQFESACYEYKGIECWSARELQEILGYAKWDNFLKVIDKAKAASKSSGVNLSDHFADIRKMVQNSDMLIGFRSFCRYREND